MYAFSWLRLLISKALSYLLNPFSFPTTSRTGRDYTQLRSHCSLNTASSTITTHYLDLQDASLSTVWPHKLSPWPIATTTMKSSNMELEQMATISYVLRSAPVPDGLTNRKIQEPKQLVPSHTTSNRSGLRPTFSGFKSGVVPYSKSTSGVFIFSLPYSV